MSPKLESTEALHRALSLAERAIGLSDPNPRVGCVITSAEGHVLGEGHTQAAGGPHAEVMALREARQRGHDLTGATAHVTLEPCAHHGRTPPCCDALIAAGLGRVVCAMQDPNPLVNGQGLARLRAAGIEVISGPPDCAEAAKELNLGFVSRMRRGRPWVRVKAAGSLDGRGALDSGLSQWITSPQARADGHVWRRRAGAILSAIGTVRADDPRLDHRLAPGPLTPLRVIVDPRFETPVDARLLAPPGPVLLVGAAAHPPRMAALSSQGAEVITLPDGQGGVDLRELMHELGRRGINELHVEAGARLNGRLLQADLVDEWLVYLAPTWIGPGRGLLELPVRPTLDGLPQLEFLEAIRIGPDLRLRLRPPGRSAL